MDYNRIIRNTFTLWYKDGQTLKFLVVYFLASLVLMLLLLGALFFFFGGVASSYLELANEAAPSPEAASTFLSSLLSNIIPFLFVVIPLFIVYIIVTWYVEILVYRRSLEILGFKVADFNFGMFLRLIVLGIWVAIAALTSWYSRKLLYCFIGLVALFFAGIILAFVSQLLGGIVLVVWFLLFLVYMVAVIYNSIRLMFSLLIFLRNGGGVAETARDAWKFSEGKVVDIFVSWLVVTIVIVVVAFVIELPRIVLQFMLGAMNQPVAAFAVSFAYSILTAPILMAFSVYGISSIYSELSGANNGVAPSGQRTRFAAKKT